MVTPIMSVQDGPRVTVQQLVKSPTVIPRRMISMLEQEFIVDRLLRKLQPTQSGSYRYNESTPLFAGGDAPIVEEFGEIPTVSGKIGERRVAFTTKRGMSLRVSKEMIDRNDVDAVNTQMTQIRNTMRRTWETAFLTVLRNHPDVGTQSAGAVWSAAPATNTIRADLTDARQTIKDAAPDDEPNDYFGFDPDVLVIGTTTENDLIQSDEFNKVYTDSLVRQRPEFSGELPGDFYGMRVIVSREIDRVAPGDALMLQTRVVGGIGDERPLQATPMYEDRSRETWRSDLVRSSAIVLDQPKAALWITGVYTV